MHCVSCEIIIEKKLLEFSNIKSVEASNSKEQVVIEHEAEKPSVETLNKVFREQHYKFSDKPFIEQNNSSGKGFGKVLFVAAFLIAGFLLLNKLGLAKFVNVDKSSPLLAFFLFGILAGLSSCAALVGGLILSMSKQWGELYSDKNTFSQKFKPHWMFNAGRLVSYAVLGGVLGAIGAKLKFSSEFSAFLVIAISILMLCLALQMLGVRTFRKFQFTMPKFITRYASDEKNFKGKYMPFLMGAATFFLPCGFTITAQGLALLSGNAIAGGLIMLFFAFGTLPALLAIGLSSVKFLNNHKFAGGFLKTAGILVLFFALFNINNQMNVLGYSSVGDFLGKTAQSANNNGGNGNEEGLPPIVNGKQVIKMDASSSGYSPNYFKVRVGVPVRWEITDIGTSGCTNAVISNSLFSGQISLTPGQVSVKEFTPKKAGKYKFSCWMGMVSGIMEVVDGGQANQNTAAPSNNVNSNNNNDVVPSGAKGCGCGGGGSSCGGK